MITYSSLAHLDSCIFCGTKIYEGGYLVHSNSQSSEKVKECRRRDNDIIHHLFMLHKFGFALRTKCYLFSILKTKINFVNLKTGDNLDYKNKNIEEIIDFFRNDYLL